MPKTFLTVSSRMRRWTVFLAERGATFHSASHRTRPTGNAPSLVDRSAGSVSDDLHAVEAMYGRAATHGSHPVDPFTGLKSFSAGLLRVADAPDLRQGRAYPETRPPAIGRGGLRPWTPAVARRTVVGDGIEADQVDASFFAP